jgi:uncharacterized protein YdcH (DUF465 family)
LVVLLVCGEEKRPVLRGCAPSQSKEYTWLRFQSVRLGPPKTPEVTMFEYDKEIVDELLEENSSFKEMFEAHRELDNKVYDAEMGIIPMDDFTMARMKKQKLSLRDKMALIIETHRPEPA